MEGIADMILKARSQIKSNMELSYDEFLEEKSEMYNSEHGDLTGYNCPICKNKGYISRIVERNQVLSVCKCMAVRNSLKRIRKSGVGDLLEEYTFEKYKTTEPWQSRIKSMAVRYVDDNKKKWLYMGGQVGCGKTHLCTAIVGELLRRGKAAIYMPWKDDIVPLKAMVMDHEKYTKTIYPLKTAEVLYVDDLFKTETGKNPTSADINIAFEILNFRYNNPNLITIISSERHMSDIIDIDEAVGSRVYQRTKDYCINIDYDRSKNYRLRDA